MKKDSKIYCLPFEEINKEKHSKEIIIVTDHWYYQDNMAMLLRLADATGVQQVFFLGQDYNLNKLKFTRVSRSTKDIIPYKFYQNPDEVFDYLSQNNITPIGLEYTNTSQVISHFNFKTIKKIALFIGNEKYGMNNTLLNKMKHFVHIPMYGNNSSMNVIMAASMGLYEMIKQDLN